MTPKTTDARKETRRALLRRAMLGAGGTLGGIALYAGGVEPYRPRLERVDVPLKNLPAVFDGFTIAQLSDLHVQPGFPAERLRPAIDMANREKPDMIALTGDYVNDHAGSSLQYMNACVEECARLHAPNGIFTIFGNHDFPPPPFDPLLTPWMNAGIRPLLDDYFPIQRGREVLWIVGLRSSLMRPILPEQVLSLLPHDAPRILLWHEPDRALEAAKAGASLQLSGHSHGGQVVCPGVGPLVLPPQGKKYPAGLYRVEGMSLYVSRGVGLLPPMVRLNCPPEVTLLTLRRSA